MIDLKNIIKGGALIGALFITSTAVFAYDQNNTHPALTDEIVDLYNLNFPDNKLSTEDKKWLINGSTDEDSGERSLFHFYDPVYNRGIVFLSSKEWALKNHAQADFYNRQLAGLISVTNTESNADFSYERALQDYAHGDRERAMTAFGHVLHLLEDAGVPDHTRNDPHPPYFDEAFNQASPYEQEMAKWSPQYFNIAQRLFRSGEKPVIFSNMASYFDRIANYSNSNFFSKDTVFSKNYAMPEADFWQYVEVGTKEERLLGYKKDQSGYYQLVEGLVNEGEKSTNYFINKENILDGYWNRLSPEIILNGTGALKLFLEDAEMAKVEYAKKSQEKPSLWAQLLGILGIGDTSDNINADLGDVDNNDNSQGLVTRTNKIGDTKTLPVVSPIVSPPSLVSPIPSLSPKPTPSRTPTPLPTPKLSTAKNSGKVVINEIAWAGTLASATDEWIELYNTESNPIDISSWQLVSSDDSPDIIFPEGTIIQANTYLLIERSDDNTVNDITADLVASFGQGGLNNIGEMMRLFNSEGIVVDIVGGADEAWYFGDSSSKNSMERIDPQKTGNNSTNWKSFSGTPINKDVKGNLINGTPKARNSTASIVIATGGGGSSGGSFTTPTPTPSPSPTPSPTPEPDGDSDGDTANLGEVVINEIAWMGTSVENGHYCEWIELRNTTSNEVNLDSWGIYRQGGDALIMSLTGKISSNSYYLIERVTDSCPDPIPGVNDDSGAFGGGNLVNTGEYLVLKDVSGTIIDQIDGSNEWKVNGNDEIIGNNDTKETAQRMKSEWVTALPTPRAQNSENITQKPSAVTNLAAAHNSPTIIATWSAPDSGGLNIASLSYDLRYSLTNFPDVDTWGTAMQVVSSSLPSVGEEGASQSASFDVTYEYGQTLYFALKTKVISTTMFDVVSQISNIATVSFPTAINANSWAMIGKNNLHTSFANFEGPTIGTISWEFDAGATNAVSQPVVSADGDAYFGAANGSSGQLIKIDKNGIKQWEYATNVSIGTPAVLSDGAVYFGRVGAGGTLAFTALNSDSSKRWDYDDASTVKNITVSERGEPYFTYQSGASSKLVALNPDGSVRTMISGTGQAGFSPIVLEDNTVIAISYVSGNQFLTSYSVDGTQLWQLFYTGANGNIPSGPSYDLASDKTYFTAGSWLFDIPSDGSILNTHQIDPFGISTTMVAISSDTLYIGFDYSHINPASGSKLFAINKSDLTTKWVTSFPTDSKINKQIIVDKNNNIYFSTENGTLYSVNSAGTKNWHIEMGILTTISPVLTSNGIIWGYGNKIIGILP